MRAIATSGYGLTADLAGQTTASDQTTLLTDRNIVTTNDDLARGAAKTIGLFAGKAKVQAIT